jgi:hypothetical protein
MDEELSRRRFVQMVAAVSTGFGPTSKLALAADAPSPRAAAKPKNLIGIQVNSFAWLDEGIDKVLDNLQEKGNINTVFAFTFFTQPTDVSGKIALPDHGTFGRANPDVGGAYYDYDPKYFRNTTISGSEDEGARHRFLRVGLQQYKCQHDARDSRFHRSVRG